MLDGADPFPGFLAVPCILGTLLVIVGGSGSAANVVSSGLSLRPLVKVGALSYSWYLIHWPLLVYAEMVPQQRDLARDTIVALVALLLAAASYRWIERPFRAERFAVLRGTRPTLIAGVALLGIMAVAGGVVTLRAGQVSRLEVSAPERVVLRNSMTAYRDCPPSGTTAGEGSTASSVMVLVDCW